MNHDAYMSVKQVADYLHLNEKKVYELVKEQQIPATKVTGKWLFPRGLVDRWLLDASHGGLLTDRLIIGGSDDPLLHRLVTTYLQELDGHALINYTPSPTRLGLKLLQARKVDACCLHWGLAEESYLRHPALLEQQRNHHQWVLLHLFKREVGFIVQSDLQSLPLEQFFHPEYQWVNRPIISGAQRFLIERLSSYGMNADDLNIAATAYSEREAASLVAMKQAHIAVGIRAQANEFGLGFIPMAWEALDMALPRSIWFRHLFQTLLQRLQHDEGQRLALLLGGYDLTDCGQLLWGGE